MGERISRAVPVRRFFGASALALTLTLSSWAAASAGRVVVVSPLPEDSVPKRLEEEFVLMDYSVDRSDDTNSSLQRLRAHEVDAVVVLSEQGRARYYVSRRSELVELRVEDEEEPGTLPVKVAEEVRSTLRAEQDSMVRAASPSFELSFGPVVDVSSYARPRFGLEAIGLWRVSDRLYLGPRAKANLRSDYGEAKSELGAANLVLTFTGCTPLAVSSKVTLGLCASAGARAIFLSGLSGPQKGESAGTIWGPLFGGAFSTSLALSPHFALKSALSLDLGFGDHSGPDMLPKRSTDILAAQSASSYFGVDFGLGFYALYLMR